MIGSPPFFRGVIVFAVLYQGYLKPGRESEYRRLWRKIASFFKSERGAIGSSLHKAENGLWIAYSRWPSKAVRDVSWPGENNPSQELPYEIQKAILAIKDCIDQKRKLPEICMEIMDEL